MQIQYMRKLLVKGGFYGSKCLNFGKNILKINIFNGDCLEVLQDIPDNSIDLIVTDPPYKMTARGNHGTTGGMLSKKIGMKGQVFDHNDIKRRTVGSRDK